LSYHYCHITIVILTLLHETCSLTKIEYKSIFYNETHLEGTGPGPCIRFPPFSIPLSSLFFYGKQGPSANFASAVFSLREEITSRTIRYIPLGTVLVSSLKKKQTISLKISLDSTNKCQISIFKNRPKNSCLEKL